MKSDRSRGSRVLGGLDFTPFSPDLAQALGDSNAALLMAELERSFGSRARPQKGWRKGSIYKHIERSTGDPDSLESRLNIGRKGITAATDLIAVRYRSPKEFQSAGDSAFGKQMADGTECEMPYAIVVDSRSRCTRIFRNPNRVKEILTVAKALMNERHGPRGGEPMAEADDETLDERPVSYDPYDHLNDPAPATTRTKPFDPYEVE